MERINKPNKTTPILADTVLIYDTEDTSDDKSITLEQAGELIVENIETLSGGLVLSENSLTDTLKTSYDGAVSDSHTHSNKSLLDDIVDSGDGDLFLADDGTYKSSGGGVVDFDNKGTVTENITLVENKITTGHWSGTNTITLPTVTDTAKQVTCELWFTTAGSSQPTITNDNLKWGAEDGGKAPTAYSTISGVINVLRFKSCWEGSNLKWASEYTQYGGVETTFTQPTLGADGTLGGSSFAVYASNPQSGSEAYKLSDGNSSTQSTNFYTSGVYWILYNPNALRLTSVTVTNALSGSTDGVVTSYTFYGSNDNSNWTTLSSGVSGSTSTTATWNFFISSTNFFKYFKFVATGSTGSYACLTQLTLNGYYIAT